MTVTLPLQLMLHMIVFPLKFHFVMLNMHFCNLEVLWDGLKDFLFGLDVESNRSVHSELLCLCLLVLCSVHVYTRKSNYIRFSGVLSRSTVFNLHAL